VKIYIESNLERSPDFLKKFNRHKVGTVVRKIYWKNYPIKLDDQIPDKLLEELVDVEIMLRQIKMCFDEDKIKEIKDEKLKRLEKRLED